ncbi:MAG TPA: T9SS type A sorting domain-containing protein, partial [Bacteroidia bacterium]|nr:T9SS type A sorting domain-containing protein [Bacteroidia bacterium]
VYDTIGSPGAISSYIATTQMNCTSVNGMAVIHVNGGFPPYSYLWSNNTTNDTAFGLSGGNYSCVVTDSHGCTSGGSATIYTACDNIVQGRVYSDPNMNCVFDNGDAGLWTYVYTVPGYYQTTTNTQGFYNLHVPAPGTYTVYTNTYGYQVHCPVTGNYTVTFPSVGDTIFNRDFAENAVPIQDIAVSMSSTPARPGFPMTYTLHYWNQGNVTVNNCVLTFTHPASLVYVSSTTNPTTYSAPTATWNLGTLTPNQNGTIIITMNVPSSAVLGTSICANANIMPVAGDVYTYNNYATDCRVIQGSLDPNYKTINCAGLNPQNGNINQDDSVLTYHIYFQNTGTDTAFNIIIEDTLSSLLNPISVVPGPSSDPYTFEQSNGLMKFNFYNIMLPDSGRDEPNSHGWVSYQVKTKPGLPIGTVIDNTAYIYFDYNTAIITNTTSDLIAAIGPSGIAENTSQEIIAYPNPFDESVRLILPEKLNGKNCEITLTDVEGRIVLSQQNQTANSITIQRGQLEAGIYFCTVRCEGTLVGNKKLIIK